MRVADLERSVSTAHNINTMMRKGWIEPQRCETIFVREMVESQAKEQPRRDSRYSHHSKQHRLRGYQFSLLKSYIFLARGAQ
jgi:hypothetical protein